MLFYAYFDDIRSMDDLFHSASYVMVVVLDYVSMLITIAGTLLAMLQDRQRPVWSVFVAMLPFVALGGVLMVSPSEWLMQVAFVYLLLLYVLFSIYMAFAVRQYGRWLRDNYADLERKEVWLTHLLSLVFMLLFILYALVDINTILLMFLMHFTQLALFVLLLWRVETLPSLSLSPGPSSLPLSPSTGRGDSTPLPTWGGVGGEASGGGSSLLDLAQIERLLAEHCVAPQLYLQHDLSLQQLAQAIGTNRSYLSQYFSRQGITYNTYINNLRINHFISRYEEAVAAGQPIVAQQLASESGYRSYSTFSLAFKQRTGQSVTVWMNDTVE